MVRSLPRVLRRQCRPHERMVLVLMPMAIGYVGYEGSIPSLRIMFSSTPSICPLWVFGGETVPGSSPGESIQAPELHPIGNESTPGSRPGGSIRALSSVVRAPTLRKLEVTS